MKEKFEYSDDANAARYLLLKETNDINFFVEDSGKEYEYEAIFERLFGDEYKINTIFGVGGKLQLIDRFKEFGVADPDNNESINVYIADGDFDFLIDKENMIDSPNFIYLKAYNIETYYIEENATVEYLRCLFRQRKKVVKETLKYDSWQQKIIEQAVRIFFTHCYVQKFCEGIENVKKGPAYFIDEKTGFERNGAYQRYIEEIIAKHNTTINDINSQIEVFKNSYYEMYGEDYIYLICGKFLLHSLSKYITSFGIKNTIDSEMMKWSLINNFNIQNLNYIKEEIERLLIYKA